MTLNSILGIRFSQNIELAIILLQLLCYVNQYNVVVFLLGPRPFWVILMLTFFNFQALAALYGANSTHQKVLPNSEQAQYCKRCRNWIKNRDHHCIFTGRCVQKRNYPFFISYLIYSYILSTILVFSILCQYKLLLNIMRLQLQVSEQITQHSLPLAFGIGSGLYFLIFTAGLLSSSFRSIVLGIYVVQQIKNIKTPKITNQQLRRMWFSSEGRHKLWSDFKLNWRSMVGQEVSLKRILLPL